MTAEGRSVEYFGNVEVLDIQVIDDEYFSIPKNYPFNPSDNP